MKRPHLISNVSSEKVQGCELHEGEWGTVGSVIYWNYNHHESKVGGKARFSFDYK
ncbi:hypothetical protein UlMin_040854 [Ulmus minor]